MQKFLLVFLALAAILNICGCGPKTSSQHFIREDVELSYIQRIAILPFSGNEADRLRNLTITQVLAMNLFDVVDKGLTDSILKEEAIADDTAIDELTLKRLGQRLNVQAFLYCSIDQAGAGTTGKSNYPEYAITLRLIDATTGVIIWQATGHLSGYSLAGRLFGIESKNNFEIVMKLIRDLLKTIPTSTKEKEAGGPIEKTEQKEPPGPKEIPNKKETSGP